jgi:CHAD domain-containing protein
MADGKWISELTAHTGVADAARHVLTARLEVVRDYLPLARHHADEDPEHVHQLRVGTRRAGAALSIFSLCLPPRVYRHARKQLKRVRRAAGQARDWDVFLDALASRLGQATQRQRPGLDVLIGFALAQRQVAQADLINVSPEPPFDFERLVAETVAEVHDPSAPHAAETLRDLARPMLNGLLNELDQATRRDLANYDNLHRVRIIGKRLRYAMEVFACCFDEPFLERYYANVEEMQENLGRANDSHTALEHLHWLRDWLRRGPDWKRFQPGLAGLIRYHQRNLPAQRRHFLTWWARWQKSGAEAAFAALLKGSAVAAS